ncbi:heparinase II/III family protein [Desulforhabdus amnigena]|uniref:Heparinase n=1 Tax=Desulforhabdus amnigena TaxID=40218 RepID=A0A9W6LBC1_9BACT|nr:alginate lyase family protein [Desulforhabdus amnigena]GLI36436.1 hypothetical protein DAMNIGENAA_38690 [Desulforhabdus amnigena]
MKILQYWHTIRYLKPVQIYGRVGYRMRRPAIEEGNLPRCRERTGPWIEGAQKTPGMPGPGRFCFLNEEKTLRGPGDWNHPGWDKLWLYNLHYFDDLNGRDAEERKAWHEEYIRRWIGENPPGKGNGWEPYPTSLRIVNWIKWILKGNAPVPGMLQSLGLQARRLRRRLEYHLLGNHLLANLKALVFAGCFFEGAEADEWLAKGLGEMQRELREQVLPDGGHFERSPMYHAIILEDLLDCIGVCGTYPEAVIHGFSTVVEALRKACVRMLRWLALMTHPDGGIVLFNDAAFGIAPVTEELVSYASRLGIRPDASPALPLVHLGETGYIRVERGPFTGFLDVAPIGPDYLPGHAHADTLNFELSVRGQRVIVDSGTSCYGTGIERQRQRSTAAHNTVEIDGENSSEVWGGFRVARRAYPRDLEMREDGEAIVVACSQDGYRRLPGKPVHRREWRMDGNRLVITDGVEGRFSEAVSRFHFHPDVRVESMDSAEGRLRLAGGQALRWSVQGGEVAVVPSSYHPQFGISLPCQCLEIRFKNDDPQITQISAD